MKKHRDFGVTRYFVTDAFDGDREKLQSFTPVELFKRNVIFLYDWSNNLVHVETDTEYEAIHEDGVQYVIDVLLNNDSVIEWMHFDRDALYNI